MEPAVLQKFMEFGNNYNSLDDRLVALEQCAEPYAAYQKKATDAVAALTSVQNKLLNIKDHESVKRLEGRLEEVQSQLLTLTGRIEKYGSEAAPPAQEQEVELPTTSAPQSSVSDKNPEIQFESVRSQLSDLTGRFEKYASETTAQLEGKPGPKPSPQSSPEDKHLETQLSAFQTQLSTLAGRVEKCEVETAIAGQQHVCKNLPTPPQPSMGDRRLEDQLNELQSQLSTLPGRIEHYGNEDAIARQRQREAERLLTPSHYLAQELAECLIVRIAQGDEIPRAMATALRNVLQPQASHVPDRREQDAAHSLATPVVDDTDHDSASDTSPSKTDGPRRKKRRMGIPKSPWELQDMRTRPNSAKSTLQSGSVQHRTPGSVARGSKRRRDEVEDPLELRSATKLHPNRASSRSHGASHHTPNGRDESDDDESRGTRGTSPRRSARTPKQTERGKDFMTWKEVKQRNKGVHIA